MHQLTEALHLQPTHCPHHSVWTIVCKDMQHGCAPLDLPIVRMRDAAMKLIASAHRGPAFTANTLPSSCCADRCLQGYAAWLCTARLANCQNEACCNEADCITSQRPCIYSQHIALIMQCGPLFARICSMVVHRLTCQLSE